MDDTAESRLECVDMKCGDSVFLCLYRTLFDVLISFAFNYTLQRIQLGAFINTGQYTE